MQGNVFNIQKFSIHDGPGIRTTVFLKGCPLRCRWCANPESQSYDIQLTYDARKCVSCQTCVQVCPKHCISYKNNAICIDRSHCIGCGSCVENCSVKAMKAEGEMMDVDAVIATCLQDADFYEESGGGVTLSGGECMIQPDFCRELVTKLHDHHISVAAETTGYIEKSTFQQLAPLFDLLLFDVKQANAEKHQQGTGVTNEIIIENLTWAHQKGISILPRIPVIPGFNAEISDAADIAALLSSIGLSEAQLLPFHQFGERKYELLHRSYELHDVKALYPEDLKDYQEVFLQRGIRAFF